MKTISLIKSWLEHAIDEGRVPSSFVVYDTETYSEQNIKYGAMKYHAHHSTELIMLQYLVVIDGQPTTDDVQIWEQGDPDPKDFFKAVSAKLPLVVFNMQFERLLYELILHPEMDYPLPKPAQWIDTASLARHLSIQGSLDMTLKAIGIPYTKQTDGVHLFRRFCVPRKPTKNDDRTRLYKWDYPEHWERFRSYGITDTWVTLALFTQTAPLSTFERKIQEINYRANYKGLPIDINSILTGISWSERIAKALTIRVQEITNGISPNMVTKLAKWLGLPNVQANTITNALKNPDLSDSKRAVLKARQVMGKTSVNKLQTMKNCATADDRLSGGFLYYGAARTGRDAGRLIQPHNFPRPSLNLDQLKRAFELLETDDYDQFTVEFPNPGKALSSCLRGMIATPKGRKFAVADYAAIEARGLNWACGQQDMVEIFAAGGDVYKEMASVIFHKPVDAIDTDERKLGKDTVLGCGYQMGPPKFRQQLIDKGVTVDIKLAERAVGAYRERHPEIVDAWKRVEVMALQAIRHPGKVFEAMQGTVAFVVQDVGISSYLFCILPSGRRLAYHEPHIRVRETSWGAKKPTIHYTDITGPHVVTVHTYGGKLVENIIQAIARDIMVYGCYKAHCAGFEVLGTVHDEIISEVPDSFDDIKLYEQTICKLPAWAKGFPIAAEGYIDNRFRKG